MASSFSSPDFRLPQNAISPKRSSDRRHICSTHSGSCTGSLGRVCARIPEISVFSTCRLRCHFSTSTSQRLFFFSMHLTWQDLRRSACSLLKAGLLPSLVMVSSFFGKSVAPDGVLWIRICTLRKAANQMMEEGFFKLFRGTVQDSSHQGVPGRFRHFIA